MPAVVAAQLRQPLRALRLPGYDGIRLLLRQVARRYHPFQLARNPPAVGPPRDVVGHRPGRLRAGCEPFRGGIGLFLRQAAVGNQPVDPFRKAGRLRLVVGGAESRLQRIRRHAHDLGHPRQYGALGVGIAAAAPPFRVIAPVAVTVTVPRAFPAAHAGRQGAAESQPHRQQRHRRRRHEPPLPDAANLAEHICLLMPPAADFGPGAPAPGRLYNIQNSPAMLRNYQSSPPSPPSPPSPNFNFPPSGCLAGTPPPAGQTRNGCPRRGRSPPRCPRREPLPAGGRWSSPARRRR